MILRKCGGCVHESVSSDCSLYDRLGGGVVQFALFLGGFDLLDISLSARLPVVVFHILEQFSLSPAGVRFQVVFIAVRYFSGASFIPIIHGIRLISHVLYEISSVLVFAVRLGGFLQSLLFFGGRALRLGWGRALRLGWGRIIESFLTGVYDILNSFVFIRCGLGVFIGCFGGLFKGVHVDTGCGGWAPLTCFVFGKTPGLE